MLTLVTILNGARSVRVLGVRVTLTMSEASLVGRLEEEEEEEEAKCLSALQPYPCCVLETVFGGEDSREIEPVEEEWSDCVEHTREWSSN